MVQRGRSVHVNISQESGTVPGWRRHGIKCAHSYDWQEQDLQICVGSMGVRKLCEACRSVFWRNWNNRGKRCLPAVRLKPLLADSTYARRPGN